MLNPFDFERFLMAVTGFKTAHGAILPAGDKERTHPFKRIHRSVIGSINKIESYTAERVDVDGVSVPIGRAYQDIIENL